MTPRQKVKELEQLLADAKKRKATKAIISSIEKTLVQARKDYIAKMFDKEVNKIMGGM